MPFHMLNEALWAAEAPTQGFLASGACGLVQYGFRQEPRQLLGTVGSWAPSTPTSEACTAAANQPCTPHLPYLIPFHPGLLLGNK